MDNIRLLLISDLHYDLELDILADIEPVITAFLEDVEKQCNKNGALDLVMFSGDLVNRGKNEQYDAVKKVFIEPLLKIINLKYDNIIFVPGNHDIDRGQYDKHDIKYIENLRTKKLETQNDVTDFIKNQFDSSPIPNGLNNFNQFLKNQQSNILYNSSALYNSYITTVQL